MPDPINIVLTVDAQRAADSVRDFVDATTNSIAQAYTSAVDKANSKIDELNRKQQAHKAVIEENGRAIQDLSSKMTAATDAELKNIESEIAKLQQLTRTRELDVIKLDEHKAKLAEKALVSSNASDQEKLAMRYLTDQRMIDLSVLRDSVTAHNAVKDSSAAEAEKRKNDLAQLIRQQQTYTEAIGLEKQQISQLECQQQGASEAQQDALGRQIESLSKSIASHQAEIEVIEQKKIKVQEASDLATATNDAERQSIQETTATKLAAMQAVIAATKATAAAERSTSNEAIADIEKVVQQRKVYKDVIAADQRKLKDLEDQQDQSSGAEEKRITQQITSLKKIIAGRQDDLLQLDPKRVKLEELLALENAQSATEEADIRKTTSGRLAEIETLRDLAKSYNAVSDAETKTTDHLGDLIGKAGSLVGIVGTVAAVQQSLAAIGRVIQDDAAIMQKMYDAANHFRDENKSIYESARPFFNQMGITDPKQQDKAQEVLFGQIAPATSLPQQNIVETASALAPYLKAAGIGTESKQFADLVGTSAQFQYRGMDAGLLGNFIGQQIKENPRLTGRDVNQSLSNLVATAGSPQYANELLTSLQEQKAKAGAAGFGIGDMQRVWLAAGDAGIAPEARGAVSKQYFQSLDRWVGQSPEQLEQLYEKGNDFNPQQLAEIEALKKAHRTPSQLLRVMTGMRHGGTNLHALDSFLLDEASTGKADIKQLAELTDQMDPVTKERFFRGEGGSRASAAVLAVTGWQQRRLPTASPTSFIAGNQQQAAAAEELQKYKGAKASPTSPGLASFETQSDEIEKYLDANPMLKGGLYSPDSVRGRLLSDSQREMWSGGATPKQQAQRMALGDAYFSLAQELQDMDDGKLPNDKTKRASIENSLNTLSSMLPLKGDSSPFAALREGQNGGTTRKQALQQYRDRYTRYELFRDRIDSRTTGTYFDPAPDFLTPDAAGSVLDSAGRAARAVNPAWTPNPSGPMQARPAGPPAPTTQPMSVNYHTRNVIYGYSADSLGAINHPNNDFG